MRFILAFSLLLNILLGSTVNFTPQEKKFIQTHKFIKVGVLNRYKPFSFEKNNQTIGFTNDLLELISKKSGLQFKKTTDSWSKIFPLFKNGDLDIVSEISYQEARTKFTTFTEPYYEVPLGIFTNGIYEYKDINSLENKKVGIIKGSFLKTILKDIKGIQLMEVSSVDAKFHALINNKVDIVISSAMSIIYTEALMFKDIKLSGYFEHPQVKKEDLRFGIRKENQLLSSIIQKTLHSISYAEITQLKREWIFDAPIKNNTIIPNITKEEKEFLSKYKTIKVSNELSWPPFDFAENGEPKGYSIDLLNLLASKIGINVEYVNGYSWSELIDMFKEKKLDLIHSIAKSKERKEIGKFTDSYIQYKTHFITSKNNININSFKDLEGKTLAIGKGWAINEFLKNYYPKIKLLHVNNLEEVLNAVSNGDADAAIENNLIVNYFIQKKNIKNIRIGNWAKEYHEAGGGRLYFMVQKEMLPLINLLNRAMDSLSIYEINQIQSKWFANEIFKENLNELTYIEKKFIDKHPVVRFRVRPNRAPFEFEKNGKALGIAVDYVKKSANNMGLKVEFVIDNSPIKEAYNIVENKKDKFDTVLFSVKTPQREKRFAFGMDYLSYPMMIISNKDAPFIGSLKDLNGKSIVLEKGFLTNKWIKKDYPKIHIISAKDTKEALEMVNRGEALAYIGNLGVANYMSVFGGMDNLRVVAPTKYGNINYSFIAPKEWPELVSILGKGYQKISPLEHSAIQQNWFALQTIDKTDYKIIVRILIVFIIIFIWILWWNRKLTSERKKTRLALQDLQKVKEELEFKNKVVNDSEQFLQSILDENPNPIIIKNYEGKFILVNKAVAKLYNTEKENMIGKDDGDFIKDKKMAEFFRKNTKEVMDSGETKIVYEDSKDVNSGEIRHFMSIKKPFINILGQQSILVIANDITDIKKLEQEKLKNQEILFSQSKVAAMGEMIGNIAHQWRQPLSVISTAATGMIMEKEIGVLTDEKLKNTLENINEYAQYLSTTIDTFRDYIKTEKEYKEVILQERIKVAINIVEASFKNNYITIKTNLDDLEPIKLKLVVGELSEVLINILNNAKDALKENHIQKTPWVEIYVEVLDKTIKISVEDNAGGISTEIMPKIFDPYFTTKHQSQGTGLGLHMSYKIITESLGGKMYVKNTKNGAKFIIELPIS